MIINLIINNMGHKYKVENWEGTDTNLLSDYEYKQYYYGESLFSAIYTIIKLKIKGAKCVKFEWR